MAQDPPVARRQVEIVNTLGLHLRAADQVARLAAHFQSDVIVFGPGVKADAKSILDLLGLAAGCGTKLVLEARGSDAGAAVTALAELVLSRFHEPAEAMGQ